MISTILFGGLALLGGVFAQTTQGDECHTPDQQCEDCGRCDTIYTTCMNACLKTHPHEPGLHVKCTHACFCETAKEGYCGAICGFDLEPHCTKKEIEVDFEIPPPDELVTKTAGSTAFVRPIPTAPVAIAREAGPEIPPPGHSITKTKSSTGLIHAVPITISPSPSIVPPPVPTPTTMVTVTREPVVKRQDDIDLLTWTLSNCGSCRTPLQVCRNQECTTHDKEAAIKCFCEREGTSLCPLGCFADDCAGYMTRFIDGSSCGLAYGPQELSAEITTPKIQARQVPEEETNEVPSAMDECYPCSSMAGLCVVNHCASSDKAAAVECACGESAPQCPSHCFASSCSELVEPYFTGMCAAIEASQVVPRQEPEIPSVPETVQCNGCYLKIGECIGQTCPAKDKDGAVKCVCDHPTPQCPASCFDGFCAEQVRPLFEIMCPSALPSEKAAVKTPKLQARQSTHVEDNEINALPQCKPQCWVKVGHCEDLCGIPAQGTCLDDCLCDAETFGIPCPHECYKSGRCG